MDHGLLNVPLTRRGNIDAQIDRYKADRAHEDAVARKAASRLLAEQRIQAKRVLDAMTPERVAELAAKTKASTSTVRRMLKSMAYFQPAKLIKLEGGVS